MIVVVGAVIPVVFFSFMAAFAIIRGGARWFLRAANTLFLMGLAIPLQATIIPIYLIIIKLKLYDTLLAIILPSIAFAIPLSVLVLSNFIRDVPNELFESMRVDGATEWGNALAPRLPAHPAGAGDRGDLPRTDDLERVPAAAGAHPGPGRRTLPLALWTFQGQYSVNVPAVLASVVLTTLPILVLYVVGRRQLLSGLTAGFGK